MTTAEADKLEYQEFDLPYVGADADAGLPAHVERMAQEAAAGWILDQRHGVPPVVTEEDGCQRWTAIHYRYRRPAQIDTSSQQGA